MAHIRKGTLERHEDNSYDLDEVALPEIPSDSYYKYLWVEQLFSTRTKTV